MYKKIVLTVLVQLQTSVVKYCNYVKMIV